MKIAYIILAHRYPQQLLRLVKRLQHPAFDCWIHLDKKSDLNEYIQVLQQERVYLVQPRLRVDWGHFNMVEAMKRCLHVAHNNYGGYDYYHFMSGSDYPLQPPAVFHEYLQANERQIFIGNRPYEEAAMNIIRVSKFHFINMPYPFRNVMERAANTFLAPKKIPLNYEIRKGPQWMTLSREAVAYLLNFIPRNPRFSNFFRTCLVPDEFYFQTILYNSPLRPLMRNQIFHYIDWSEKQKSPKTLTLEDKERLLSSPLFFARKFDALQDTAILDLLDMKLSAIPYEI